MSIGILAILHQVRGSLQNYCGGLHIPKTLQLQCFIFDVACIAPVHTPDELIRWSIGLSPRHAPSAAESATCRKLLRNAFYPVRVLCQGVCCVSKLLRLEYSLNGSCNLNRCSSRF